MKAIQKDKTPTITKLSYFFVRGQEALSLLFQWESVDVENGIQCILVDELFLEEGLPSTSMLSMQNSS